MSKYIRKSRNRPRNNLTIPIKSQFNRLKSSFPNIEVEENDGSSFSVVIKLRPDHLSKEYDVRIKYDGGFSVNVYIVNEKLMVASNREELPHVYNHEEQKICLYSRSGGKWTRNQSIVSTIVPWASEWLYYYEHWLIDGEWKGGGHPEYDEENTEKIKNLDVKEKV